MTLFDEAFAEAAVPALKAQFGESVVYYPVRGPQRRITVRISRSIQARPEQFDAGDSRDLIDVAISCDLPRHPVLGIIEPVVGDKLHRSELGEPRTKLYQFDGKVVHAFADEWVLEFELLRT